MTSPNITNIDELVSFLCQLLQDERDNSIDLKQAVEINNTAGKIINAAKVKILYLQVQNTLADARIPFLESSEQKLMHESTNQLRPHGSVRQT